MRFASRSTIRPLDCMQRLSAFPSCRPGQTLVVANATALDRAFIGRELKPHVERVIRYLSVTRVIRGHVAVGTETVNPLVAVITAGAGGNGGGISLTDKTIRDRWFSQKFCYVYEIHLRKHIGCGAISVWDVALRSEEGTDFGDGRHL